MREPLSGGPETALLSSGDDLALRRNLLAVPVLDHAGVMLLDHRHAGTALLGDRGEGDAGVDLKRDEARAEVAGAGAGRRAPDSRLPTSAVVAALGLTLPHP